MNLYVLILSLFLTIAVLGCDSRVNPVPTPSNDPAEQPVEDVAGQPVVVGEDPPEEEPVVVGEDPPEEEPVVVGEDPPEEEPVVVGEDPPEEEPVVVGEDPPEEEPVVVGEDPPEEEPVVGDPAGIEVVRPVGPPPLQVEINKLPLNQQAAIATFKKGSKVFVRNTGKLGLRIRFPAGQNRIGGMFDGETGTITAHPQIHDNLAWFFIEWDAPVKNPGSGCGIGAEVCLGWSVAVLRDGTKVLNLLR